MADLIRNLCPRKPTTTYPSLCDRKVTDSIMKRFIEWSGVKDPDRIESLEQIDVPNLVLTGSTSIEPNPVTVAHMFLGRDGKSMFPASAIPLSNPDLSLQSFGSGQLVMAGTRSYSQALVGLYSFIYRLAKILPGKVVDLFELNVCNVVGSAHIGHTMSLEKLALDNQESCNFNQTLFPGAHMSFPGDTTGNRRMIVFSSGFINLIGCRDRLGVFIAYYNLDFKKYEVQEEEEEEEEERFVVPPQEIHAPGMLGSEYTYSGIHWTDVVSAVAAKQNRGKKKKTKKKQRWMLDSEYTDGGIHWTDVVSAVVAEQNRGKKKKTKKTQQSNNGTMDIPSIVDFKEIKVSGQELKDATITPLEEPLMFVSKESPIVKSVRRSKQKPSVSTTPKKTKRDPHPKQATSKKKKKTKSLKKKRKSKSGHSSGSKPKKLKKI